MNAPARPLESLTEEELAAISTIWKRERRELATSFSGTSMLPAIIPGQPVIIECGAEPTVGDVVAFRRQNQVGVHRVVALSPSWLLTWGDANPLPDEPLEPICVIGVIRDVSAARTSLRRVLLRRLLASAKTPVDVLTRRVRFAYSVVAAWIQGPRVFARKCLRALLRPKLPCRIL